MIPYVHVDDLDVLGIKLHPFGLLVAAAVISGAALAKRRARQRGLDLSQLESFIGWSLVCGFLSAHALDEILYHPREVLQRPWSLLYFWDGLGSFSGWVGALVGVVLWKRFEWRPLRIGPFTISRLARRSENLPILPFADIILSVFPVAWIFGRAGCSVVHDHPGVRASDGAALAVAFPSPNPAVVDGPGPHAALGPLTVIQGQYARYDLGALELVFTIAVALVFVMLWRRRLLTGTYAVIVCLAYPPVRFAMEFLRIGDPRYFGLTPAQWFCVATFVLGLVLWRHVLLGERRHPLLAPPP